MVYIDQNDTVEFSTDNEYWIKRILADAEEHPEEIEIILLPAENNGSIKARIPNKYLDIRPEQIII